MLALALIASTPDRPASTQHRAFSLLRKSLFFGSERGYNALGHTFEPYKKALPGHGQISFITCRPFKGSDEERDIYWNGQAFLVPLILTRDIGSEYGIIYCDTDELAQSKLSETGYKWIKQVETGKGIVAKVTD